MSTDGGPAFPQPMFRTQDGGLDNPSNGWGLGGMSLRDYFAAKAINLFSLDKEEIVAFLKGDMTPQHEVVAKWCYALADEMLRVRDSSGKDSVKS